MRCAGAPRPSLIHYRRLAKRRLLRSVCQSTRIWIKLHQSAPRLPVAVRRIERKHAIFPVGCLEWGARGFRPPRCRAGPQSKFCMGGEREGSHAHDSGRGRVANGREPPRRRALCAARGERGGSERRPGADDSAVSVPSRALGTRAGVVLHESTPVDRVGEESRSRKLRQKMIKSGLEIIGPFRYIP